MSTAYPRPVALQLYTLRDLDVDFPTLLRLAADIGFAGVEPAGLGGMSASEVRPILDDLGLQVCSSHGPVPDGPDAAADLEEHRILGSPAIFPSLRPDNFVSAEEISKVADRFATGAVAVAAAGLELGYHNHWWEFSQQIDGRPSYYAFVDALRERGCAPLLEVDLYWVQAGGADPAEVISSLGDAARYLHVKDGPATTDEPMTALGTGKVDLPAALGANEAVRWHIVELDRCATDMVEAVRASYRYLVEGGFSTGRA
jgi:sugar phosphate isomerase/epimerase